MRKDIHMPPTVNTMIDFYEFRLSVVEKLLLEANNMIHVFRDELEQMTCLIRLKMTASTHPKPNDIDGFFRHLITTVRKNEAHVKQALIRFYRDEQEIISILKGMHRNTLPVSEQHLTLIRKDIRVMQKRREQNMIILLQQHHSRFEEVRSVLRKRIDKGDADQIKPGDIEPMIKTVKTSHHHGCEGVLSLLDRFDIIRSSVCIHWEMPLESGSARARRTEELREA